MLTTVGECVALAILAVMLFSVTGLLAVWAGLGRPHWFLRIATLEGFLALWLIVPAYDIVLVLSAQAAVATLPLLLVRFLPGGFSRRRSGFASDNLQSPHNRFQFSILDLLLVVLALAIAMPVGIAVSSAPWRSYWSDYQFVFVSPAAWSSRLPPAWAVLVVLGTAAGLTTLVAVWVAFGRRRLWPRLVAACLLPASLPLAVSLVLLRVSGWMGDAGFPKGPSARQAADLATRRPARTRAARVAAVVVSLLILGPLAIVFYELATPAPIPQVELPDPNGYDDLVRAAMMLDGVTMSSVTEVTPTQLRDFVTTHRHVLDLARRGLDRECRVRVDYCSSLGAFKTHMKHLTHCSHLRQLTRALIAEGRLAEADGRPGDAMESYLDAIRLGPAVAHGGDNFDRVIGRAIEETGSRELHALRKALTADQCRKAIATLQRVADGWEPWEDHLARYRVWYENALGWQGRMRQLISRLLRGDAPERPAIFDRVRRAERSLLLCEMALQAYHVERGEYPEQLADLVPEYLPAAPEDPFSEQPLVYRRNETSYALYSVGPDRADDGARPLDYGTMLGDVLLREGDDHTQ